MQLFKRVKFYAVNKLHVGLVELRSPRRSSGASHLLRIEAVINEETAEICRLKVRRSHNEVKMFLLRTRAFAQNYEHNHGNDKMGKGKELKREHNTIQKVIVIKAQFLLLRLRDQGSFCRKFGDFYLFLINLCSTWLCSFLIKYVG